ncbi:MAG TPA: FHA domain-containing protein [Ktedonobacteraceae bacterium]
MEASLNGPLGRTTLGQGVLRIGRAADNALVITDQQSSAYHAEVGPSFGGNDYQVTDLGSTNGTFVNEQRLQPNAPRLLSTGDTIRIGALVLTYEASGGYAPTVAARSFNDAPTSPGQGPTGPTAQPTIYPQAPVFNNYNPNQPPTQPRKDYPQAGNFNQPGYPQAQPGASSQAQPPRKSRLGLWIGLIVLLLLLIGGGITAFTIFQNRSTPEKTLQAYCTALQNNDPQGIYNTLSTELQVNTDLPKIKTALQVIDFFAGGSITGCTFGPVQQNGNSATTTMTFTPKNGKPIGEPVQLVYEKSQWKITTGSKLPGV